MVNVPKPVEAIVKAPSLILRAVLAVLHGRHPHAVLGVQGWVSLSPLPAGHAVPPFSAGLVKLKNLI